MSDTVRPHRWKPTRLPRTCDSPGKNTGVGCHFLLQCVKVKCLSRVWLPATPWTAAYQAPLSMGFSRQEYWSGLPVPSPIVWSSGGDGIPAQLFQILKDDAVKMLHSLCQQIWKTKQWPQSWKSFHSNPKESNAKICSNCCTVVLISHASKVMLKILQTRLQQYVNQEFPDVQAGFRKGRRTRGQIANIHWIMEKARGIPEKHLPLFYWLH